MKTKQAQFDQFQVITLGAIVTIVLVVAGFRVLSSLKASQTANSFAANATATLEQSMNDDLVGFIPLAIIVGVIVAIIGVLALLRLR